MGRVRRFFLMSLSCLVIASLTMVLDESMAMALLLCLPVFAFLTWHAMKSDNVTAEYFAKVTKDETLLNDR